ncbi:MAG TPA: zinc ABC transporter substrate-binding protein, partial [Aggregatilineales bacterium]|nr:zinc ABC transporter substrate-binding protein [Aggregatilineales bacterium]
MNAHTHRLTGIIVTLVLLTASISGVSAQSHEKLNVVATTTQAADLMNILARDAVNLTALMGAGVDPHLYQPTESDIEAMNQADVVIYSGLHLEGQFDTVFEALGERNVLIYRLSKPVEDAGFVLEATNMAGFAPG